MKTTVVQTFFVAVLAVGLSGCSEQTADAPPAITRAAAVSATSQLAPGGTSILGFVKLTGKWQRTDGDYLREIRTVEPDSKIDSAYRHPQPIQIAIAEASQNGETIKALIEPCDVNYPTSTSRLRLKPIGS